jgi:hypothetical protein
MELLAKTCKAERMNIERLAARIFVAAGGVLWAAAAFGASFTYQGESVTDSVASAFIPLGIAVVAFLIGWFYENLAAVLLLAGAVVVVAWGVISGWEPGVWMIMIAVLVAPMVIAALLYMNAARMQKICTLEEQQKTAQA